LPQVKAEPNGWTPSAIAGITRVSDVARAPVGDGVLFLSRNRFAPPAPDRITRMGLDRRKAEVSLHVAGEESLPVREGECVRATGPLKLPQWVDGERLAVIEDGGLYLYPRHAGPAEQLLPPGRGVHHFRVAQGRDLVIFVAPHLQDGKPRLWMMPLTGGRTGTQPQVLTPPNIRIGAVASATPFNDDFGAMYDMSPDGTRVAFTHRPSVSPEYSVRRGGELRTGGKGEASVSLVDLRTREITALADGPTTELKPKFSPDSTKVAYLRGVSRSAISSLFRVVVADLRSGGRVELAPTPDYVGWTFGNTRVAGWNRDGSAVYVVEASGVRRAALTLPVNGGPVRIVERKKADFRQYNTTVAGGSLCYEAAEKGTGLPEAFGMNLTTRRTVQFSKLNESRVRKRGKVEVLSWTVHGRPVEGILTHPVNERKGRKYPLIVCSHGGPNGNFGLGAVGSDPLQSPDALPTYGYFVLRVNHMGSVGYGPSFRSAFMMADKNVAVDDILAGARSVADRYPIGDIGVSGWSWGGYLALAASIAAREQGPAIRAATVGAVSAAYPADLVARVKIPLDKWWFGGDPDKYALPVERIPRDLAVLISHGGEDYIPIDHAQRLRDQLATRGNRVELDFYPGEPHLPTTAQSLIAIAERQIDWFGRHLSSGLLDENGGREARGAAADMPQPELRSR
jgi:dienelactone hydrolase